MNIKEAASQIIDAYFNGELEERYATANPERQTLMTRFKQGTADGELRRPEMSFGSSNQGSSKNKPMPQSGGSDDGRNKKPPGSGNLTAYKNAKKS